MALRTKVKALLAGGASAIVIAAAMLGGNHGLEGRRHELSGCGWRTYRM